MLVNSFKIIETENQKRILPTERIVVAGATTITTTLTTFVTMFTTFTTFAGKF